MQNETNRKLATVRRILEINPIENADSIERITVDGWNVVGRKEEYSVGHLVIYLEIDSWVPTEVADFLSKGKEPRVFNEVKGERLRSIKLRGQLSQGMLLPVSSVNLQVNEGDDLTEFLGIQKWEKPMNA